MLLCIPSHFRYSSVLYPDLYGANRWRYDALSLVKGARGSLSKRIHNTSVEIRLEAAVGGHVLGFFAGDTPVISFMDGFIMLPSGFVVNGKPLDGLRGQSLQGFKYIIINGIQKLEFKSSIISVNN